MTRKIYELSGGKKGFPTPKMMQEIGFNVGPDQRDRIVRLCHHYGLSATTLFRAILFYAGNWPEREDCKELGVKSGHGISLPVTSDQMKMIEAHAAKLRCSISEVMRGAIRLEYRDTFGFDD